MVGYIIWTLENALDEQGSSKPVKIGHILNLAVQDDHSRKGIGSLLVKSVLDKNSLGKVHRKYLEVGKSNLPAINLYLKFSFNIYRTVKKYYSNNEDAYIMVKECP